MTIAFLRCARISAPFFEAFDEIGSSSTKSNIESNGSAFPGGGADGIAVRFGIGVGGNGYAPAVPTPMVTNAKRSRLRLRPSRGRLTRFLFAVVRRALTLFDELFDLLSTLLTNAFVEVGTIAITRGFAALLSTLLADLFVELVAVS